MAVSVRSSVADVRPLPERPSLEHLRNEAKSRLKFLRASDPTAQLSTAQLEIARAYGFPSWRRLHAEVTRLSSSPVFENALTKSERLRIEQALSRQEVAIDPAILDGYVGYYELNQKSIISVQREGNELIARLTGQTFLSLAPESNSKFFYRNSHICAQLSFITGIEGIATTVTLHQNGWEQTAGRVEEDRAKFVERLREERQAASEPLPGSEDALRRLIELTRTGTPDYALMSERLAHFFKEQLRDNMRAMQAWGDVISIKFLGVSKTDDSDIFEVDFAAARTEWRLTMAGPEKIGTASIRVLP
ncbi:hypothetical protein LNAOJCKE_1037 [Methylorubrum aminovorans]|uniref:Peptidase S12 Pab87-related C-terminal domain-containing protein n=1 Tax=Methylorubrum aminovorans TaxID=269069 RepID=A0ABQ4U916_9HYPH|nr:DUF3471 domain-containing protein [Methylorubrum aminovorans]GJE63839.1 hypothetical protein LNAOJCKE_1037 [Methylorubrum aminovorans]GMA78438.1 hypothetical protein GCM10025880_48550 [Methylorubrum aminovorans]